MLISFLRCDAAKLPLGLRTASSRAGDAPLAIVDVPLLYETGANDKFDKVIVTDCPPHVQIARLIERGLPEPAARQRLAAQLPTQDKAARADFVIRTDGPFAETDRQVEQVLRTLSSGSA